MKNNNISISFSEAVVPLLSSLFFLCVYVPVIAYVNNSQEFLHIRPWLLFAVSVGVFIVLSLVTTPLFFVLKKSSVLLRYVLALLCGLTIAFYVQGNLINLNYGVLDGREIPWDKMVGAGIVNALVWVAILLGFFAFAFFARRNFFVWLKTCMLCFLGYTALILGMRCATVKSNTLFSVDFTMQDFMVLSKERNVLVFIVDTFDQSLFDELLETRPEVRELLKGFTYYKNTIGKFPSTKGALPHILTGIVNDNSKPFVCYKENAYLESPILQEARNQNFSVDMYTSSIYAPTKKTIEQVKCINNVAWNDPTHIDAINYYISVLNSSFFSYLPHFLKSLHNGLTIPLLRDNKRQIFGLREVQIENVFFREGERDFDKMEVGDFSKKLKFYHTAGVHAPFYNAEKGYVCLMKISQFLDKAKRSVKNCQLDVVIMADHGHVMKERPLFMCSNLKGQFIIDETPLSYDDFSSILIGAIRGNGLEVVKSNKLRTFYFYSWDNGKWGVDFLPTIYKRHYNQRGDFVGSDGFSPKKEYAGSDFPYLGTSGFEIDGTYPNVWLWTYGRQAMITLPMLPEYQNKDIVVEVSTYALLNERKKSQELGISVGGENLQTARYSYPKGDRRDLAIIVPRSLNKEKKLQLQFNVKSPIAADFWEPVNPMARPLGVMMTRFSICEYKIRDKFKFSNPDPLLCHLVEGFSGGEQYGRWSCATNAIMDVTLPRQYHGRDVSLVMQIHPFLYGNKVQSQRLKMAVGNETLCDKVIKKAGVQLLEVNVPGHVSSDGTVRLFIHMPDCASPKELGMSEDPRKLAVFFRTCEIKAVDDK